MSTTDTNVKQLVINRLTATQFNGAVPSGEEAWWVDPEFAGGKLLATDANGDIVESTVDPANVGTVTSVNNVSPVNGDVTLSIPTVNNPTITITQGGVTKGSFTLNQSSGDTIALDAGGGSQPTYNSSTNTLEF